MKPMRFVCSLLMGASPILFGQTPDTPDTQELIRRLMSQVAQLEKRVAELESKAAPAAAAPAAPVIAALTPTPVRPAAASQQEQPPPPEMHSHPSAPAMKIAGFSDFNFSSTNQRGTRSGFTEGQFILHTTTALSSKVNVFGEVSFSARGDAGTGTPPATGFNAEVERLVIRFDQSDFFKVSFGRYHTPINWWNNNYHHGQWLQTTVSRPEMTQFGGRFIPVHFVGGLVEGAVPAGGLNLNYNVGLGNGRGSVISRGGDAGDNNNNRAVLLNLFVKPNRFYGLQAGGSVYKDKVTLGPRNFDEWITSGHIVWAKENPEVIAEFANVRHSENGRPVAFNSQAWYVQMGYRLPWGQQQWKPYYRFEYIHVHGADPVFTTLPSLAGSVAGIRYDLTSFAAFKLEYRNLRRPGVPRISGAFAQTSFTF